MSNWTDWPAGMLLVSYPQFYGDFPNLRPNDCAGNPSPATQEYNCIAWAASVSDVRWEPDPMDQFYWPDSVTREYTLDAFIEAYKTIGFEVCSDGVYEQDTEKIALYAYRGSPEHAARQLENGNWTTKFGHCEDVEHLTLECLEGPLYGKVTAYMKRSRL